MTNVKVKRKDVLSDAEVKEELTKASEIKDVYRRLRAKAIISLLETGKRRHEIASLKKSDIWQDNNFLYVRFTVQKKRRKSITSLQRTKKFYLSSEHSTNILTYLAFLSEKLPYGDYVFPYGVCIFGEGYVFDFNKPINDRLVLRVIKQLNPNDWAHQHRERRAVKVIRSDEAKYGQANLETVYKIRNVLDLEREDTAYRYIRRHETQLVEGKEEAIS